MRMAGASDTITARRAALVDRRRDGRRHVRERDPHALGRSKRTSTTSGWGLWWAVQTVTTVGYGDTVPQTLAGRALATLVMLTGIGFISVVTAAITAAFIESARRRLDAEQAATRSRTTPTSAWTRCSRASTASKRCSASALGS